jgi:predicted TIM-barrel fold metal-dependent hydrolase
MRFPGMKWSLVEGGIGWIAAVLDLMDHWWTDHKGWMKPRLEQAPSTYFRRNFFATFEDDRAGVRTRDIIGVDNIMWGSDYPHTEGVWPFSRRQVGRDFVGCPPAETRKIVYENVARAFGFPLAA